MAQIRQCHDSRRGSLRNRARFVKTTKPDTGTPAPVPVPPWCGDSAAAAGLAACGAGGRCIGSRCGRPPGLSLSPPEFFVSTTGSPAAVSARWSSCVSPTRPSGRISSFASSAQYCRSLRETAALPIAPTNRGRNHATNATAAETTKNGPKSAQMIGVYSMLVLLLRRWSHGSCTVSNGYCGYWWCSPTSLLRADSAAVSYRQADWRHRPTAERPRDPSVVLIGAGRALLAEPVWAKRARGLSEAGGARNTVACKCGLGGCPT